GVIGRHACGLILGNEPRDSDHSHPIVTNASSVTIASEHANVVTVLTACVFLASSVSCGDGPVAPSNTPAQSVTATLRPGSDTTLPATAVYPVTVSSSANVIVSIATLSPVPPFGDYVFFWICTLDVAGRCTEDVRADVRLASPSTAASCALCTSTASLPVRFQLTG